MFIGRSPGWYGIRREGGRYFVLRDVRRHRLMFTERNGRGGRCVARFGPWQFWVKPPLRKRSYD